MTGIVALESQNVKRLKAVTIKPDGSLVIIGGRNAQGKTSVLDSIMYALAGKRALPKQPLRKGEQYGKVSVTLDSGLKVTRSFTEDGGGTLTVEGTEGEVYRSPQKMLDKLTGALSFDPLEFDQMRPGERVDLLAKLCGLDLPKLEAQRDKIFQDRATANRAAKDLKGALSQMGEPVAGTPDEEVSVSELAARLAEVDTFVLAAAAAGGELENIDIRLKENLAAFEALHKQKLELQEGHDRRIAEIGDQLHRKELDRDELKARIPEQQEVYGTMGTMRETQASVHEELAGAEEVNTAVRLRKKRIETQDGMNRMRELSEELTTRILTFDKAKEQAIKDAELPIDGLGIGDSDVLYQDIPWEQASLAERIRVSVSMGFALNSKLKVLLVRDGSGLDEDNLALCAKLAEENDGQLWIERVGDNDEAAIIIEDGMVRGAGRVISAPDQDAEEAPGGSSASTSDEQPDMLE